MARKEEKRVRKRDVRLDGCEDLVNVGAGVEVKASKVLGVGATSSSDECLFGIEISLEDGSGVGAFDLSGTVFCESEDIMNSDSAGGRCVTDDGLGGISASGGDVGLDCLKLAGDLVSGGWAACLRSAD